ncbi:ABC transporter ATP-binding protein [Eubacteriales bacterium OttesenSCG-928-N14]|nr:ABC transporter ATP-binding protein [Eubacteriales bacterium OttesenSCG-928-N14]
MQLLVENLSAKYNSTVALEEINFQVSAGDYLCILGGNGAGKSTLIKCLLGLHPSDGGSIQWQMDRCDVAYLPQHSTIAGDFPATVEEVVLLGRQTPGRRLPMYTHQDRDSATAAMEQMDIINLRKRRIGQLSGGQLQRALLARALCKQPKLLILDEPSAGMDEHISGNFLEQLRQLNAEGLSIMMITHDTSQALADASHILLLQRKQLFYGTKQDFAAKREGGELDAE